LAELAGPWTVVRSAPGEYHHPGELAGDEIPAQVPGTAAGALAAAGRWRSGDDRDFDAHDWWFRTTFTAEAAASGEQVVLALDGLATLAEVYLNGELVLTSESMFAAHRIDVGGTLRGENELAICCRALAPKLAERRRPRARWRTRLVTHGNQRFFRTMLLGRAPGFAPGPAVVGPWRPVRLERTRGVTLSGRRLRTRVVDGRGELDVSLTLATAEGAPPAGAATVEMTGPGGLSRAELSGDGERRHGSVIVPGVARWWPHTHGEPVLYQATLVIAGDGEPLRLDLGRVGFRELTAGAELERDGLRLSLNGTPVFARGAVWTPLDLTAPHSRGPGLRRVLERVRDAGMNMLRVPGVGCYESAEFYDLCDQLGILVWQDFMFANLDYPEQDEAFMTAIESEAAAVLEALGARPSLAVLCGGSEVAQQVAMLGLDSALADGPLYGELLPRLVAQAGVDAPYVPSTPWGGTLPFRPDRGVANYYGVGAYRRPLTDARLAGVKFAAECLAFANVPDEEALAGPDGLGGWGGSAVHDPRWKRGVPRDTGAGWDFEDVRDHYLAELHGVDPAELRSYDHQRYLELSRQVSGEVMAEVFGEWRRSGSSCAGGLVLWLTDLRPGAGWGLLDHRGEPKVAYHHLRRALAPVAVWSTDEGLGGVHVHAANDGLDELAVTLRVALYRDLEIRVEEASRSFVLAGHETQAFDLEGLLGRFVDASWAYRFGPPGHDAIIASLEGSGENGAPILLAQDCRFPVARPAMREPAGRLGLSARIRAAGPDAALVTVTSGRLLYGVRLLVPGYEALDDAFCVEPGHSRTVPLRRSPAAAGAPTAQSPARLGGSLSALNLSGRAPLEAEGGTH
jgi:beta-mannosidase